jgi:hypothetical protein
LKDDAPQPIVTWSDVANQLEALAKDLSIAQDNDDLVTRATHAYLHARVASYQIKQGGEILAVLREIRDALQQR